MQQPTMHTSGLLSGRSVRHGFFGRHGGVSEGHFATLNCGPGSADTPEAIRENRQRCQDALGAKALYTAYQIHSDKAVFVTNKAESVIKADAIVTNQPDFAIGIITADCMPVLFHDPVAGLVGAAHAGWRGALSGILENCVSLMREQGSEPSNIRACFGPCLRMANFEVGLELVDLFTEKHANSARHFHPGQSDEKRQLDLVAFGCDRLLEAGLQSSHIDDLDLCTLEKPDDFFSYRRSRRLSLPDYGRNLSAISLTA
ncbi:MAG: peptidoglycan editing factor PgeF [Aquisalinus sp.]|nr:peptidoglycan editing factor PgeF [Aquisalinus sp.]